MRSLYLFFTMLISIQLGYSQSAYTWTAGVDPGWTSSDGVLRWQAGCNAVSTNCGGNYANNTSSTYTSAVIDATCLNASTVLLSFDIIGNVEFGWDFMYFEYSTNGITWTNIVGPGIGLTGNVPALSTLIVPGTIPASPTLQIRFRFESDFSFTSSGYQISNLSLDCNVVLPVELTYLDAKNDEQGNVITWTTASEINCSHFDLHRSVDGSLFEFVGQEKGNGNASGENSYEIIDTQFEPGFINYYRLIQVDFDGEQEVFDLISVDNRNIEVTLLKKLNLLGQMVDENYSGIIVELYSDGSTKKVYQP